MNLDFSIPPTLPVEIQNQLNELIRDYKEEDLTAKGYDKKRRQLLSAYQDSNIYNSLSSSLSSRTPTNIDRKHTIHIPGRNQSLSSTFIDKNIQSPTQFKNDFNSNDALSIVSSIRTHPRNNSNAFPYNTPPHSIYKVTTNSSILSTPTRPNIRTQASSIQLSLPSHDTTSHTTNYMPMVPLLPRNTEPQISSSTLISQTRSLLPILRGRFENYESQTAMISINPKGKETYITWDKLYLRAEKVANELKKHKLYKMDKILLWYNKEEIVEFTVALLGCFIAGMVAVPISFETYSLTEIVEIIKQTNSTFILISNECYKQLDNLHTTTTSSSSSHGSSANSSNSSSSSRIKLSKNEMFQNITFLKTDDLGTYSKAKKQTPTFEIPNVAYIEFTRTPLGRLSGVVMKHNILMNQFNAMSDILDSKRMPHWRKSHIRKPFDRKIPLTIATKEQNSRFMVMNTLDPTRSTGLIFGVLFNIFTGNLLLSVDESLIARPGGYETLIDRYRADILLNDQLQLKQTVINYLENPTSMAERKKHKLNFSCMKCCLTACTTIDTDVTDMIVHKWLKNLGCADAALCYSPLLTLIDFGGVFISTRDQLGGLENFPIHNSKLRLQDEIYVSKEALKSNKIETSPTAMVNSMSAFKDYIKLESFGFPIPDTSVCIVNPDDGTLVPDLCVGEIWLSSRNLVNEFYQMEKVNDFVFKAKLNYSKMLSFTNGNLNPNTNLSSDRLQTILSICPASSHFVRTKLMGFVHNGKLYVLSLIEDMFLQNHLIRLPNWAHTSDMSKIKDKSSNTPSNDGSQSTSDTRTLNSSNSSEMNAEDGNLQFKYKRKRIVETHYLQQITETLVRTVNTVSDVSAFESNRSKEEHFLVVVIESSLVKTCTPQNSTPDIALLAVSERQNDNFEKKMNDLTDQVYRILWIFHKIQPMCVVVVACGSLPRRYCSLELANSTVERKFISGELESKFVKFQFDNIILDYIPHSGYYNESIFSEHLSKLRRRYIAEKSTYNQPYDSITPMWQTSGIDFREVSYDLRTTTKNLTDYRTITDILEWRIEQLGNESAFTDGTNTSFSSSSNSDNNIHKNISWKSFDLMVAAYLKKITGSKTPLSAGDRVCIMCDNSVEYVAIVMACLYCNFIIIPIPTINEKKAELDMKFLCDIITGYKVKRLFVDAKVNNLFCNNNAISKLYRQYKHIIPKITVISKLKKKNGVTIKLFKNVIKQKFSYKNGTKPSSISNVIWIRQDRDITKHLHVKMNHASLLKVCKILKETLQLSITSPVFSLCSHTTGLGFILSCMIGIYVGTATNLFSMNNVLQDPKEFLIGIQNLNVRNLYFKLEDFRKILHCASNVLIQDARGKGGKESSGNKNKHSNKDSSSTLSPTFFRNVKNIMISFLGRPSYLSIENLLTRYQQIVVTPEQINFLYEHHFNPIISLGSYLDIPPIDVYLDCISLREGIIKEIDPTSSMVYDALRLQDSGVVPVCTDVTIVNPETLLPCLEGEIGEIWCCSEANAFDYVIFDAKGKLTKDKFITDQFQSKFSEECQNGLTYLRTGDLGFIRNIQRTNADGDLISLNLLYVLGSINETIEILGLTHFATDLEKCVKETHRMITNCLIAKAGGLLVCLVQCRPEMSVKYANLCSLIVSDLLNTHGVVVDLVSFVKNTKLSKTTRYQNWNWNRSSIIQDWFKQKIEIDTQFAVNYGENISIYLLSDFEKSD